MVSSWVRSRWLSQSRAPSVTFKYRSFAFLLYDETGDERYLKVALGALDWLNQLNLIQDETIQYYPLSKLGPTKPMYVLEDYSAGWPH